MTTTTRPAVEGEYCTCGRPAREVFVTEQWGEVGYCGRSNDGRRGPCPWCGTSTPHAGRCPQYRIREEETA